MELVARSGARPAHRVLVCDLLTVSPTRLHDLLVCHTEPAIRYAVRRGVLLRPFRGVFVGSALAPSTALSVRAAQLSIGRDLPASHHTAANLYGSDVVGDELIHLVGPEEQDHSPQPGLWVHSTSMPPTINVHRGVNVTGPNRTAVDVARMVARGDLLAVLDAALRTELVSHESIERELHAHRGLRGVVAVRAALGRADGRAESPQESRLRWIILAAGLPAPDLQVSVRTRAGLYRMDMAWPHLRVGLEYDGDGHAGRQALRRDRTRHNALDEVGWRLRYFTDVDVHVHPQRTADQLALVHGVVAKPLPVIRAAAR